MFCQFDREAETATLPATPKKPVTDTYQGVQVVDEYRWLENGSDPAVKKWAEAQNEFARAPSRQASRRGHFEIAAERTAGRSAAEVL